MHENKYHSEKVHFLLFKNQSRLNWDIEVLFSYSFDWLILKTR